MGGCAKHLQGTWTDQRQGELLREITLNTMVRINTNRSSIPELLRQCAQEGRGHVWHPNKIHSEKAWTCLKMESSATKVWFGQSKKSYIVRGNLLWFSATNFCVFFRNSFPKLCGKVTNLPAENNWGWCYNLDLNWTLNDNRPRVQHVASSGLSDYLNELHQVSLLSDITLHHETEQNFVHF